MMISCYKLWFLPFLRYNVIPDKFHYELLSCTLLLMGFKLMAGAVASCALIGVAVGVGIIYGSLLISIGRNPHHSRSNRYILPLPC